MILESCLHTRKPRSHAEQLCTPLTETSGATVSICEGGEKAVDRLLQNLKDRKSSLEYRLQLAQVTLTSLQEKPRTREPLGRNTAFTCSNCRYRGHQQNTCRQPPCQGYFECWMAILHKEYREQVKQVRI